MGISWRRWGCDREPARMTPQERAFLAAIKQRLAERGALLLATEAGVIDQLKAARALILEQLAAQPGDFAQWRLPQLLEQIEAVLAAALGRAAGAADEGLSAAWQQGEDFVDKPLAAGGLNVEIQLPVLDATVLQQMRGQGGRVERHLITVVLAGQIGA